MELYGFKIDSFGNISTISEAKFKIQTDSYRYEITDGSVTHDEKTPAASTFKFSCAIRDDNWKGGCFKFEGTCYPKLGRYEGTWSTTTDQKKGEFVLQLTGCKPAKVKRFFEDRSVAVEIPDYLHFKKGKEISINEFGAKELLTAK